MKIKNIKLKNFRSYDDLFIEFDPNINIFIGENGVGKTNILEAIYVLSLTKSNRYGNNIDLIKNDKDYTNIIGEIDYNNYLKKYQINIDKLSKKVFINNQEIKRISDYISNFCVTSFSPDDINIINGSPSDRRNNLNIQIGEIYNNYLSYVNEYNTLLKMRNEYLKTLNINGFSDYKYLDIINEKMIEVSLKIYYYRFLYIDFINMNLGNIFKKLTGISDLKLFYNNNLNVDSYDEDKIKSYLRNKYKQNLNKEIMQGVTLFGIHRDDLSFKLGDLDSRIYASVGQQKLIVIAYKISELLVFKKIKKEYPVLLLDDVFSELDVKKRNNIIKYFKDDIQIIITTNDLDNINKELVLNSKVFSIKNGCIKVKGGVKNVRRKS